MGALSVLFIVAAFALVQVFAGLPEAKRDAILAEAKTMFDAAARRMNDLVFRRRNAYLRTLTDGRGNLTPDGRVIVAHLAKFCRATTSKGMSGHGPAGPHIDPHATLIAVGRNEVFMAIMKELSLPIDRVFSAVREDEDAQAAILA